MVNETTKVLEDIDAALQSIEETLKENTDTSGDAGVPTYKNKIIQDQVKLLCDCSKQFKDKPQMLSELSHAIADLLSGLLVV